jgi:hypothetical protein
MTTGGARRVTLLSDLLGPSSDTASVCTTSALSTLVERLQFDLGEGPCIDAFNEQRSASGMVAAQLDVAPSQALTRLRAYAFGSERDLTDVATDVVHGRLRFDPVDRATKEATWRRK